MKNPPRSHGTGEFQPSQFARLGQGVVFEPGVLVFHPENIEIEDNVYIGHYTILKGYYQNRMLIGSGTWIGQQCFFHSAGGIEIGRHVGIGPGVKILTSSHQLEDVELPILHSPVQFAPVVIRDNSDIGVGVILLPGVTIGIGAQVGAGAVVTNSVDDYAVVAGVPAKVLYYRKATLQ
jgi:acetyltransferase-like isoleucine patch superfamily enzyme